MAKKEVREGGISKVDLSSVTDFKSLVSNFKGQKVAVLAARYQYRGVLTWVGEDSLMLSPAMAVEDSGRSENVTPQVEDSCCGFVTIKFDAIEIFYQPNWAFADIQGENMA